MRFGSFVPNLGNAITNADGRFQMKFLARVKARSDIRAYFPASASLVSQTATVSH